MGTSPPCLFYPVTQPMHSLIDRVFLALRDYAQVILPFTVSIMYLVAWSYDLDPLLVFMGLSETVRLLTLSDRRPLIC